MNKLLSTAAAKKLHLKQNILLLCRNYAKKIKEGCECPDPPPDKIVEEKKCITCSFTEWKPKTRKQIQNKLNDDLKPKKPRKCYAGMVIKKPAPACKTADLDPLKKKLCLPRKRPLIKEQKPAAPPPELKIPKSDWDHNC